MVQVILFTDRAPEQKHRFGSKLNSVRYSYSAGAHKLASVLRQCGFSVLVVPSCLNLTFNAVKKIINQNLNSLIWVGISTSLMQSHSPSYKEYRQQWMHSNDWLIDPSLLFQTVYDYQRITFEMPWAQDEIWALSNFLKSSNIPLILGGSHVTRILNGGIKTLDSNTYVVRGNAEEWVKDFTNKRQQDPNHVPSYVNDNDHYDNNKFKQSTIHWTEQDLIDPNDWLPIEIARGCAFNCAYCSYEHKGKFDLYKDTQVLRDELIRNYELFGVTRYMLVDDLYNDSKEKVRILYDQVWSRLPFKVEWTSYMRLDMFWADPESIQIIEASGAKYGTLGIETLHDRAGRKVGKGLGRTRTLETLEQLKAAWGDRVLVNAQMIAGLPDEPYDHIVDTINWTIQTDLLHSVTWAPLFISPMASWRHTETSSAMSLNNEKYEITWEGKVWRNNQGLTFAMVDDLVSKYFYQNYQRYRVHFGNYPDLRVAGLTHDDIVHVPKTAIELLPLDDLGHILDQKVKNRLYKIIEQTE